jgi:lipoprotein-anchoring transpeptidase ErfK/SrfK
MALRGRNFVTSNGRGQGRHRKVSAAPVRPRRIGAALQPRRVGAALTRRRTIIPLSAVAVAAGAAAGVLATSGSPGTPAAHLAREAAAPEAPGVTDLATLRSAAPRYASPGVRAAGTVPASWYGYPSILPVIGTSPGWVHVRLAQRPDGSTAWVSNADVSFSSTPYQIVVNLTKTTLALYKDGHEVFSAPAGVGTPTDPTPPGQYFVAFTEPPPQPNPGYGPFIMVTSDHSQTISDWEGSGDAVIGIHGPLGSDLSIGSTGAELSHGCIRLHVQDQLKLQGIPPGTPVTISS